MLLFSNVDMVQWFEIELGCVSPFLQFLIIVVIFSKWDGLVDNVWKVEKYGFGLGLVLVYTCFELFDFFRNHLRLFQKAYSVATLLTSLSDLLRDLISRPSKLVGFSKGFPPL